MDPAYCMLRAVGDGATLWERGCLALGSQRGKSIGYIGKSLEIRNFEHVFKSMWELIQNLSGSHIKKLKS